MDASRAADCYGCFPGHTVEIADVEQAYVQAELKGTPTWVSLPPDQAPERYRHMREPDFPLRRAFYGHPDSGTFWEQHCHDAAVREGFRPVGEA